MISKTIIHGLQVLDGLYENIVMPAPLLSDESIFEALPSFLKQSLNRDRYFWRWDTDEKYQKNMKAYLRMITGIDTAVGRVMDELNNLNLADNTIIIYTADNGYYMGNRGFAGKWSHYAESMRIPMIIFDPRVTPLNKGTTSNEMALNVDIASTLLDLAEIQRPHNYQGHSLLPIINGNNPLTWRNDFFSEHLMNHQGIPKWEGVRTQEFVHAKYFQQEPAYEFLHDLTVDPNQLINYADNPIYKEQLV